MVNFKILTSRTGQQIIARHLLPSISKSKDNQAMEFIQLIRNSVRNIFHKKSCIKCGRETSSEPFLKSLYKVKTSS